MNLLCAVSAASLAIGGLTLAGVSVWQGLWWAMGALAVAGLASLWRSVSTIARIADLRDNALDEVNVRFSLIDEDPQETDDREMSRTVH